MDDRRKCRWVLLFALLQALVYLALVPPWQHYDEPTHFEHAWLMANRAWRPSEADVDLAMRRELVESMRRHHFYRYAGLPEPDPRDQAAATTIGISELRHPPLYYALASLPLRLARGAPLTAQLYLARAVSLLLFLLTVHAASRLSAELAPPGHALRWGLPLALCLLPPFVDLMTAVNNDAGAICLLSLFLWGAVRLLRRGWSWPRGLGMLGAAVLAAAAKSTGAIALPLLVVALLLALWQRRGWRWRWLVLAGAATPLALAAPLLSWDDAAYWYYPHPRPDHSPHSRLDDHPAAQGSSLLTLAAPLDAAPPPQLISPLLPADVEATRGRTVTVGGWIWASRPLSGAFLSLAIMTPGDPDPRILTQPLSVTTAPRFVAWSTTVPADAAQVLFTFQAPPGQPGPPELAPRLFLGGALLTPGRYASASFPSFDDMEARAGVWDGRRFANLLRNPSGQQVWPRLDQRLDRFLARYGQIEATLGLAGLLDYQRTAIILLRDVSPRLLFASFAALGWGQPQLFELQSWALLLPIPLLALAGVLRWALGGWRSSALRERLPALALLALCAALLWAATIFRALPALGPQTYLTMPRYAFPAMLPLMLALAGGWWALPPRRWRTAGLGAFLLLLLLLDLAALRTIWLFYYV